MDLTGAGETKGDGLGVVWRTAGWRVSSEAAVAATLGRVQLGVLGAAQMGPPQSGPSFSPSVPWCGVTE